MNMAGSMGINTIDRHEKGERVRCPDVDVEGGMWSDTHDNTHCPRKGIGNISFADCRFAVSLVQVAVQPIAQGTRMFCAMVA